MANLVRDVDELVDGDSGDDINRLKKVFTVTDLKENPTRGRDHNGNGRRHVATAGEPYPAVSEKSEGKMVTNEPQQSLKDQLLAQARTADTVTQIRERLKSADEIAATPELVKFFVSLIQTGDQIGIRRLGFEKSQETANQEWLSLPWEEWINKLTSWQEASDVIEKLQGFIGNTLLRDALWNVVIKVERPCRGITGMGWLIKFLEPLYEKRQVQRFINPRMINPGDILIQRGVEKHLYLPFKGTGTIALGWPYIREAYDRAVAREKEQIEKAKEMDAKATPGLTPVTVTEGNKGVLSLFLPGNHQRVLVECMPGVNGKMMARIVKTLGVHIKPLPSDWVLWAPETGYVPIRGNQWPTAEIPIALKAWEERMKRR